MSKRKGKSKRRVKDWRRRFRERDVSSLDAAQSETLQPERVKIPTSRVQSGAQDGGPENQERLEGMVIGLFPGGAVVRAGGEDLLCAIAGTFRAPPGKSALAVGDVVAVALNPPGHLRADKNRDGDRADGVILSRRPRDSALSRPQPGRRRRRGRAEEGTFEKVIAANMEVLLIVASTCQPPPSPGLIDRFCIVAERGEMQPIVALNKIDLAHPDPALLSDLRSGQIATFCCSAKTGMGLQRLLEAITGRRSVLAGASGVGKSTLVNALVPGANLPTRGVRSKDQRGRHVTAAATLHELPGGGIIVDTPGVRELALDMAATELPWYFPELAEHASRCRFNDCTHTHEPCCAVRAAVENGELSPRRYRSYLRILETL